MSRPIAVLISDIHFTPSTLELASKALSKAIATAKDYGIPLVLAGDTLDTKAVIRAECANRLLSILGRVQEHIPVYVLVGNHDLISEKSKEHSLHFLRPYCKIIDKPTWDTRLKCFLIPYMNDSDELETYLRELKDGARIIMHQGVQTAFLGHYVQDKTSLIPDVFAKFRVISGHYHRAQDIECGQIRQGSVGLFSYIGNPYSLSFAEAHDGQKGFQLLYEDGHLEQIPTNLRKHIIVERNVSNLYDPIEGMGADDLVWIKLSGYRSDLDKISKNDVGDKLIGHLNFKFDKMPLDSSSIQIDETKLTGEDILDKLIENSSETDTQKSYLKALWREVLS